MTSVAPVTDARKGDDDTRDEVESNFVVPVPVRKYSCMIVSRQMREKPEAERTAGRSEGE
jgi:hypothetical protein